LITVYHNPRCSKSRECLALPELQDKELTIVKYLETPPAKEELKALIKKLGIKPIELVRTKEEAWQPYRHKKLTPSQIITLLARHPQLIERPIVVNGNKAVIARPAAAVKSIL
jgi:arsenate reductase (glutaredoxin)